MALFDMNIARLLENGCQCACLVVKLSTEVATFSDDMRAVLAAGMREWQGVIEQVLVEGQKKKVIRKNLDPTVTASMIQDLWMGASQRTQVQRSVAPLRAAAIFVRKYLSPN
jgi:TetR/AcrR family transcriptional repressor of nem operon